jgi:transposase
MKKVKQVVGIDVSKDTLAVCYGSSTEGQRTNYSKSFTFKNDLIGFIKLYEWVEEFRDKHLDLSYVMEATGVYYENLAYFLTEKSQIVHVLLPNKAKHFAKSLDIKSKTDEIDAKMLTQVGLERQLVRWQPQSENLHIIKQLCREYKDLKEKLTVVKNQLHAKGHGYNSSKQVIKRLNAQAKILQTQLLQVECELQELCSEDESLSDKIAKMQTVPGLSFITIITIVAETNGFLLIENSKQLCSYSGLDVVHNQSGLFKGKSKISKKGNSFIRRALFMPALCAIQHNPPMKEFYEKLVERKKIKKVGLTAVLRKLLVLSYTLWKNNSEFQLDYKKVA